MTESDRSRAPRGELTEHASGPPVAMMPAYGGMFRPRPPRLWPKVLLALAGLAVVGGVGWYMFLRPHPRTIGIPCTMTAGVDNDSETYVGCNGGLCIREYDETTYCSEECLKDEDCPSGFVCDPTRSRRRRACMEENADITPPDAGAVPHVYRRRRAP